MVHGRELVAAPDASACAAVPVVRPRAARVRCATLKLAGCSHVLCCATLCVQVDSHAAQLANKAAEIKTLKWKHTDVEASN